MAKNVEYRSAEINVSNESRYVEGYALKFNSESVDMGFKEVILPTAIDLDTIKKSDVFALIDHDKNKGVLARSRYGEGTLNLEVREDGLFYSFEAPNTNFGDELLSYLRRGEITQSSFGFVVDTNGGDEWERRADGTLFRTIKKIYVLTDVSPVFQPAYEATTVTNRKLEEAKALLDKYKFYEDFFDEAEKIEIKEIE